MTARRFVVGMLFISCCSAATAQSEREMNDKASALTKLSAAVETTVRYRHPSPLLSEDQLLKLSTAHDPRLLTQFRDYSVRVFRDQRRAIVMLCTVQSDRALLEDAACTPKLDRHHWRTSPGLPCELSLKAAATCGG